MPVGASEDVGECVIPLPSREQVAESIVGEVDVPLPLDFPEWTLPSVSQSVVELAKQSLAFVGGDIEPMRAVTPSRSLLDGGLVSKRRRGTLPPGHGESVDDEPSLPFADLDPGLVTDDGD